MFRNYLKITWKVLMRNKLFTFISLFGISLTLTILIVGASFYDFFTKSNYPAYKQDKIVYASQLQSWKKPPGEKDNSYSRAMCSYYFLNKCCSHLGTPQAMSFYSFMPRELTVFINSKKFELIIKYSDEKFWDILDFKFEAGRPFNKMETDNLDKVAVIVESLARNIFGDVQTAVGKTIDIDDKTFKVVGIVKDVPITSVDAYANVYCPITTTQENIFDKKLHGEYQAMFLLDKRTDIKALKYELEKSLKMFEDTEMPLDYRNYVKMEVGGALARFISFTPVEPQIFFTAIFVLVIIIILIPSLNLINLNVNRINERLAEIGIRKSFGARKGTLIWQFIIENIVITLMGGVIAFMLSYIVLKILQTQGIVPSEGLLLNYRILFTGIVFCFLFGFIAGVLPAYRMSRLQIVESLKNGES